MALLKVKGVSKWERDKYAVNEISLDQSPLQRIAIAGETGSGKSTLLKLIAGLAQPDRGEIFFRDEKVIGPFDKLIPGHPGIAYLSQYFELRNNYRVEEELECRNRLSDEEADHLYSVCRIHHLLKRKTDQLSGGEKQRIALARLLTASPKLLLLDEPFSHLDSFHKSIIKSVIHDLGEKLNITCMLVSHDANDILSWADHIIVLRSGVIVQQGSPRQTYFQPCDEYCAGLLGDYNLLEPGAATLFAANPTEYENGKRLLVRPEQFILDSQNGQPNQGVIRQIQFKGGYEILQVNVKDQLVLVRTNNHHYRVGDEVGLSLRPDSFWFV